MSITRAVKTLFTYYFKPEPVAMKGCRRLEVDTDALKSIDAEYGDFLIHPCVRYIKDGFAGHKWWMVVTPYPRIDDRYENPVLFYGLGDSETVPDKWSFVGVVQEAHSSGYNADCNLFYDGSLLWIIWKETNTPNTTPQSDFNCIMGRSFDGRSFGETKRFMDNPDCGSNRITAPSIIKIGDQICCLATHYEKRLDDYYHPHGRSGLSLWKLNGDNMDESSFFFEKDLMPEYPEEFDFWHSDFFVHEGCYYCVVSNERATTILLGRSDNGVDYKFYRTPLLSKTGNLYVGMYKPSAVAIGNFLHLFFPRKNLSGNKSSIYCSTIAIDKLINIMNTCEKASSMPLYESDGQIAETLDKNQISALAELRTALDDGTLRLVNNKCLCGSCNGKEDVVISAKDRYGLPIPQVMCKQCGLIRSALVFDEPSNGLFYSKYYRKVYTSDIPTESFFNGWQVNQGRRFLKLIKDVIPEDEINDVAEVGCGAGGLLLPFKEDGKAVIGYDFNSAWLEFGRSKGLDLRMGDFYQLAEDASCDLVILSHVIEHFLSPVEEMRRILAKVRPGKYLIMEVPGIFNIEEAYGNPILYFQNAHVYNFYERYLRVFFSKLGLEVLYGDEHCTFICKKVSDVSSDIGDIYDTSLSEYPSKILDYFTKAKFSWEHPGIKRRIYDLACKLGWKKIRKLIFRNK